MHAWLDFITKLEKYTSFAYSWSTREEWKNLDAVVPDQLLAANAYAVAYQMENYKTSGFVVILHCLDSFQHNNNVVFSLLDVLLRKIHKILHPSFHNGGNPACKMWRRLQTGEFLRQHSKTIHDALTTAKQKSCVSVRSKKH